MLSRSLFWEGSCRNIYGFRFGTLSEDDILATNKTAVSANLNAKKAGKFGLSYLTMARKIFFLMNLQPIVNSTRQIPETLTKEKTFTTRTLLQRRLSLDLHNSSDDTQPHPTIVNYTFF